LAGLVIRRRGSSAFAATHEARQGMRYGIIYAKRFPATSGSQVRFVIDAPVTQFEVFPPGL
jgi:2-keto-3-deoxy-6-phosphogluconate aldolase